MKIFGLMVVKNEGDIIEHTLLDALKWCDEIYVLDNGSDDATWEIINRLAQSNPALIVHGQSTEPFSDKMRSKVFNAYRERARVGDWWCRLDADEIYVTSPRTFLAAVTRADVVWAIHLQFYFTDADLARYETNPDLYASSVPPTERLHYYLADASEPRFFRYRPGLQWPDGAWPVHMGRVNRDRILVRHYKFRSPAQIQKRAATRSGAIARGGQAFMHWTEADWTSYIKKSSDLCYDAGDGRYVIDEKALPAHRDPLWRDAVKRIMHGLGVWP